MILRACSAITESRRRWTSSPTCPRNGCSLIRTQLYRVRVGRRWEAASCGHYAVETVNTVVDETQRGDITRREYVVVDKEMLLKTLASVHDTTHKDRADFRDRLKKLEPKLELDAGERDLLAHIMAHEKPAPNILILTMSDRAAVRACCALEWGDCLVSIERLHKDSGSPPKALGQPGGVITIERHG